MKFWMAFLALVVVAGDAWAGPAQDLWRLVQAKYLACSSFSCTGTQVTTADKAVGGLPFRKETAFVIRFERPESLMVYWTDAMSGQTQRKKSALYAHDGKVSGWPSSKAGPESFASLEQGMEAYAGVSGGLTRFLPLLLLGNGKTLKNAKVELGESFFLDGESVRELHLKLDENRTWTLLVNPETLTVMGLKKVQWVSQEQAEKARRAMEETLKKQGLPIPALPPEKGYSFEDTVRFSNSDFAVSFGPGDFEFSRN